MNCFIALFPFSSMCLFLFVAHSQFPAFLSTPSCISPSPYLSTTYFFRPSFTSPFSFSLLLFLFLECSVPLYLSPPPSLLNLTPESSLFSSIPPSLHPLCYFMFLDSLIPCLPSFTFPPKPSFFISSVTVIHFTIFFLLPLHGFLDNSDSYIFSSTSFLFFFFHTALVHVLLLFVVVVHLLFLYSVFFFFSNRAFLRYKHVRHQRSVTLV